MRHFIIDLGERVLTGGQVEYEEALKLEKTEGADIYLLSAYAAKIREVIHGNHIDLCSIVSARTGGCAENCAFCAQSAHHKTETTIEVNLNEEEILIKAKEMEAAGVHRFDIVTSGKGYSIEDQEFNNILDIFTRLRKETSLQLCACLGAVGDREAEALAKVGVTRYNHNIETAKSFFPNIVSTHTYQERVKTIEVLKKYGIEVCSGGVIGMGETFAQRIEFAFALRDLEVASIPLNVLNPIKGTPLENVKPLQPLEIIKTMSMFRFILPKPNIRLAGGRETNLRSLQTLGLVSGINGMLTGNYLTTKGQTVTNDIEMIKDLGFTY